MKPGDTANYRGEEVTVMTEPDSKKRVCVRTRLGRLHLVAFNHLRTDKATLSSRWLYEVHPDKGVVTFTKQKPIRSVNYDIPLDLVIRAGRAAAISKQNLLQQ